jgi:predicted regulator of Ras-like GTPase activity (Roadblock/LC7/MglB family)
MALVFEQLIYTSFSQTGFKLLVSQQISKQIEEFFLEKIVYQYWDTYNPPPEGYKAVYLHQLDRQQSLFGWLYNRGHDDLGRSDIPYFVCYSCDELLEPTHLNYIFNCLQKGPLVIVDCKSLPPINLESITIANLWNYQSAAQGVEIPSELQQEQYLALEQNQLLNLFVAKLEREKIKNQVDNNLEYLQSIFIPSNLYKQQVNIEQANEILQELISENPEIQGAALVSPEGQLLSKAIGIEQNSVLAIAGIMLYLNESVCDQFNWQDVSTLSLQSEEGQTIRLIACTPKLYLLLETVGEIDRVLNYQVTTSISKLKTELALT